MPHFREDTRNHLARHGTVLPEVKQQLPAELADVKDTFLTQLVSLRRQGWLGRRATAALEHLCTYPLSVSSKEKILASLHLERGNKSEGRNQKPHYPECLSLVEYCAERRLAAVANAIIAQITPTTNTIPWKLAKNLVGSLIPLTPEAADRRIETVQVVLENSEQISLEDRLSWINSMHAIPTDQIEQWISKVQRIGSIPLTFAASSTIKILTALHDSELTTYVTITKLTEKRSACNDTPARLLNKPAVAERLSLIGEILADNPRFGIAEAWPLFEQIVAFNTTELPSLRGDLAQLRESGKPLIHIFLPRTAEYSTKFVETTFHNVQRLLTIPQGERLVATYIEAMRLKHARVLYDKLSDQIAAPELPAVLTFAAAEAFVADTKTILQAKKKELQEHKIENLFVSYLRVTEPEQQAAIGKSLQEIVFNDAVPYSLGSDSARAQRCFSESIQVITRGYDVSKGFGALTFEARSIGDIPASLYRAGDDLSLNGVETIGVQKELFPGNGILWHGIDARKVFGRNLVAEAMTGSVPMQPYIDALPWAANEFPLIGETQYIFLRGAILIIPPRLDRFNVADQDNLYLVFNDHFHPARNFRVFMLKRDKIERAIHEGEHTPFVSPRSLVAFAEGLPINLGWASNLGGLCNALPPKNLLFHEWENDLQGHHTKDIFGHVHKSHITGQYLTKVTKRMLERLLPLRKLHTEVYEAATSLQNLFDIFRVTMTMWHKGVTLGKGSDETDLILSNDTSPPISNRMLVEAYRWHKKFGPDGEFNPKKCPILTTADMFDYWNVPGDKIRLDTFSMNLTVNGERVQLPRGGDGEQELELNMWAQHVAPSVLWSEDIRFYDRESL